MDAPMFLLKLSITDVVVIILFSEKFKVYSRQI